MAGPTSPTRCTYLVSSDWSWWNYSRRIIEPATKRRKINWSVIDLLQVQGRLPSWEVTQSLHYWGICHYYKVNVIVLIHSQFLYIESLVKRKLLLCRFYINLPLALTILIVMISDHCVLVWHFIKPALTLCQDINHGLCGAEAGLEHVSPVWEACYNWGQFSWVTRHSNRHSLQQPFLDFPLLQSYTSKLF